jgi:phosphatidylethanolamine-binding protein (PEBP) family uncharacterized protein
MYNTSEGFLYRKSKLDSGDMIMKKMYVLGMAALVMLTFMGCPDDEIISILPDGPSSPGWIKGLGSLVVKQGENPGEIQYQFDATNPEADTYILYYIEGRENSSDKIIAAAKEAEQTESVNNSTDFETITLTPGKTYSVVVVAKKTNDTGEQTAKSGVKIVTAKDAPQITLTVSGIPAGTTIFAATLFDDALMSENPVPLAVGLNRSGVFSFVEYVVESLTHMGGAWKQTGEYYIVLATDMKGTTTYKYTNDGQTPVKYDFTQAASTIAWDKFTGDNGGSYATQLKLTVSDIPAGTTIFAATLFDDTLMSQNPVPLAVGMNINGVFSFSAYDPESLTQIGGIWTQTGEYYIILATAKTGGTTYIYINNGQAPAKYNFTQGGMSTIPWSSFVQQQQ